MFIYIFTLQNLHNIETPLQISICIVMDLFLKKKPKTIKHIKSYI